MKALFFGIATLAAASASVAADLEIFRCTAPKGKITYQPVPCPLSATQKRIEVLPFSAGYDPSEGGTLFKRETELDKRLAESAAKEAESAKTEGTEGTVPTTLDRVGKAHAPVVPTETSNEARHEHSVSTSSSRKR